MILRRTKLNSPKINHVARVALWALPPPAPESMYAPFRPRASIRLHPLHATLSTPLSMLARMSLHLVLKRMHGNMWSAREVA